MARCLKQIFALLIGAALTNAALAADALGTLDGAVAKLNDWNSSGAERNAAISTLRNARGAALDHVRVLLKSDVWMARRDAVTLAAEFGPPNLGKMLAEALVDKNWAVRECGASLAAANSANRAEAEPGL